MGNKLEDLLGPLGERFDFIFFTGLALCHLFNFAVNSYGAVAGISLGVSVGPKLTFMLISDFFILFLLDKVKTFFTLAFVSMSIKMLFDFVYGDAGHIFVQQFLLLGLLILFSHSPKQKELLRSCAVAMLLLSYFFTGFQKFFGDDYFTGNAILKVLGSPEWNSLAHSAFLKLAHNHPVLVSATGVGVLVLEAVFPWIFLFFPRARKAVMASFVAFHLGTYFLMDLTTFPIFMIILDLCVLGPVAFTGHAKNSLVSRPSIG